MAVMIGIDPHKGSHTAAAIDEAERDLGEIRIRSGPAQLTYLLKWAAAFPERSFAIEGAHGLGYLLSQQLVAAGEEVLDVQPKMAARVRMLASGRTDKNDPNDARSVAVAALRSPDVRRVHAEDHAQVMKLWTKRVRDLSSSRTRLANRLHALLLELVPGGHAGRLSPPKAARLLEELEPDSAVSAARLSLALELTEDLRRIERQIGEAKERLSAAVAASGTTTTEIVGVGPFVAATVVGYVADVSRFASRHRFAAYNGTAPIEVSSGPRKVHRLSRKGNRRVNCAIHIAAVTQVRVGKGEGRAYYERKLAEGKTHKEALRALKRRISDALYARMRADARRARAAAEMGPGGHAGNVSDASATGLHPEHRLFGEATPGPDATLGRRPRPRNERPGSLTLRVS